MKKILFLLIMMGLQVVSATVEDLGGVDTSGAIWPPPTPYMPTYLPCPVYQGRIHVEIDPTGPIHEVDKGYTTQGRPLDFTITARNEGPAEVKADLCILPENCAAQWFSWTTKTFILPAGASRSENLPVTPDINAVAGKYKFKVDASARCAYPGSACAHFTVQNYDYASETSVSGTGQFQMSKDVRSMNTGIKSDKDLNFVGSVDDLVKNEYLVEQARGRTPNFQEQDAVDNYNSLGVGALKGTEVFRSSRVFGGVGARITEKFNLDQMDYKNQDFKLHQTGSLKNMAEFKTADNFTGFLALDARQSVPGQRSMNEREAYSGAFEIARRLIFRDVPTLGEPCFGGSCFTNSPPNKPCLGYQCYGNPTFSSPCLSGSCTNFVKNLNNFARSA
jgi:hypothetical protein